MKKVIFALLLGASLAFPAGASHATFSDYQALIALQLPGQGLSGD